MRAQAASLTVAPGRWLGPQQQRQQQAAQPAAPPPAVEMEPEGAPVYGVELTAEQWDPLNLHQTVLKVRWPPSWLPTRCHVWPPIWQLPWHSCAHRASHLRLKGVASWLLARH